MLSVMPTGAALGAEIQGVDLAQDPDDRALRDIVDLLHRHEVVYFREQTITAEQHIRFSHRFGELEHHVRQDCCRPGYPEIFVVSNVIENGKPIGSRDAGLFWHSDLSYMREPSRGSLFYAREVPQDADGNSLGDTLFASTVAAYDALDDGMKRRLGGLMAVNSYVKGYYRDRESGPRPQLTAEQLARVPDVEHPVVRTHPHTGRKCLFVNEGYTARIAGMDPGESDALLAELFAHVTNPAFVYRHKWQVGDFLIWDNCAVQHLAIHDYALPQRRRMERTTLRGSVPY